jgi:hypothetical protein
VRRVLAAARSSDRAQLSELARAEAERLFSPATVAATLVNELERVRSPTEHAMGLERRRGLAWPARPGVASRPDR